MHPEAAGGNSPQNIVAFQRILNLCVSRNTGSNAITESDVSAFAQVGYLPDLGWLQRTCTFSSGCLEALKKAEISAISPNLFFIIRLKQFLDLLAEKQVTPVLLKGIALQLLRVEQAKTREMTDIDLLLQKPDVPKLLAVARDAGFHMEESERSPEKFSISSGDFAIDVTTDLYRKALLRKYCNCTSKFAFERKVPFSNGNISAFLLSPEDELIYSFLHMAFHIRFIISPKWLIDLYYFLVTPKGELDWGYLRRTVTDFNIQRPIFAFSRLLEHLFRIPIWTHFDERPPKIGWLDRVWLNFLIFPPRLFGWRFAKSPFVKRLFASLFRISLLPRFSQKLNFGANSLLREGIRAWKLPGAQRWRALFRPKVLLEATLLPLSVAYSLLVYIFMTAYVLWVCRGFRGLEARSDHFEEAAPMDVETG